MAAIGELAHEKWTHPSVIALTKNGRDPTTEIITRARRLVLMAISDGWSGPPFDPSALASLLGIAMRPRDDIADATLVPTPGGKDRIEFNPNRPLARVRYSVAHEIAHTLFEDYRNQVHHRARKEELQEEEWQLEVLCNIAAAEILMPIGAIPDLDNCELTIERVGELRRKFEVSTEAVLLRAVKLSRQQVCAFSASRVENGPNSGKYRIDYVVPARGYKHRLGRGRLLPADTVLSAGAAVGFTIKGDEEWIADDGRVHIEAVAVQPYMDQIYPRVVGFFKPLRKKQTSQTDIRYVVGDATQPRGKGHRILAHIVNDKTPNWGAGFAAVVRAQWPPAQEDFQHWVRSHPENLKLGNVRLLRLETQLSICHMVSQRGYGPSVKPRVRYDALAECLEIVGEYALAQRASVHMPRIGTGQAGGSWGVVEELIKESLCGRSLDVTVYDLRGTTPKRVPDDGVLFPAKLDR